MQQVSENTKESIKEQRFIKLLSDLERLVAGQMSLDIANKKYATKSEHPLKICEKNLKDLKKHIEKDREIGHSVLSKSNLETMYEVVNQINGMIK